VSEPRLVGVSAADLDAWLPRIAGHLARIAASTHGAYWAADLVAEIRSRDLQLWTVQNRDDLLAVFLTRIVQYPRLSALQMVGCVGRDWRGWAHLLADVERFAIGKGCRRAEPIAPRKWRHLFRDYRETHVVFEKDL